MIVLDWKDDPDWLGSFADRPYELAHFKTIDPPVSQGDWTYADEANFWLFCEVTSRMPASEINEKRERYRAYRVR